MIAVIIIIILIIIVLNVAKSGERKPLVYSKLNRDNSIGFEMRYAHLVDKYGISSKRNSDGTINLATSFNISVTNKPYFLIFDLETTGQSPKTDATKNNFKRFPRIVQFAWLILDKDYNIVDSKNKFIKQDEEIPYDSKLIHKKADEIDAEKWDEMTLVLDEFLEDLNGIMFIVAHNIDLNYNIIKSEMFNFNKDQSLFNKSWCFCTMKHAVNYCKIPKSINSNQGSYGDLNYKYPKLYELIKKCYFEREAQFYMTKMNLNLNVRWTAKCLQKLIEDSKIDILGGENLPENLFSSK